MGMSMRDCVNKSGTRTLRLVAPLAAALLLGACAKSTKDASGFIGVENATNGNAQATADLIAGTDKAEAAKAYWATTYANNPRDDKAAVAYARILKGEGEKEKALSVLQQAAMYNPDSTAVASEQGRLALDLGQLDLAEKLIARADDPASPDWRIISAKGTIAARRGDKTGALTLFEQAVKLAPNEPSVLNNLALAYALNGQAQMAEPLLRRAAAAGGDDKKVRQNLALVLGVQGKFDEARQVASTDLAADTVKENATFLTKMVKATPVLLTPGAVTAVAANVPAIDTNGAAQVLKGTAQPQPEPAAWDAAVAVAAN